ncbi:Formyl-CoA:oxalate CoA-transferase [Candidatus Entotheonellaceae bacterium PAL068K]
MFHTALGETLPLPGPFARFHATPLGVERSAPRLGEHNGEILAEELGLAADNINPPPGSGVPSSPAAWPQPSLPRDHELAAPRVVPQRLNPANGRLPQPAGNRCSQAAPHGIYRCKGNDRWCAIAVTTAEEWRAFREVMGNPGWSRGARFASLDARLQHVRELDRRVEAWTRQRPSTTVMERLQHAGVPAGVVQNGADLHHDPQLKHRGFFVELEHPRMGRVPHDGHQFHLSETPGALWSPAPLLGQHTDTVLQDILHLSPATIAQLRQDGVLE